MEEYIKMKEQEKLKQNEKDVEPNKANKENSSVKKETKTKIQKWADDDDQIVKVPNFKFVQPILENPSVAKEGENSEKDLENEFDAEIEKPKTQLVSLEMYRKFLNIKKGDDSEKDEEVDWGEPETKVEVKIETPKSNKKNIQKWKDDEDTQIIKISNIKSLKSKLEDFNHEVKEEDIEASFDKVTPIQKFSHLLQEEFEVENFSFGPQEDSGESTPSSLSEPMSKKRHSREPSKRNSSNSPLFLKPQTSHKKRSKLKSTRKVAADYKNLSSYKLSDTDRAVLKAITQRTITNAELQAQLKETGHTIESYKLIFTVTDEKFKEHKKCEILYNNLLKKMKADSIEKGIKPTGPIIHDPNNLEIWKINNPLLKNRFK
jgi:hypothetical protein